MEVRIVSSEADNLEFDDSRVPPPGKIVPFPSPARAAPDWLTGPADGLGAASDPQDDASDEAPAESLPQPVLKRPGFPASPAVPDDDSRPVEAAADVTEEKPAPAPGRRRRAAPAGAWAPAASSVPVLREVAPSEPEPEPEEAKPLTASVAPPRGLPSRDEDLSRAPAVPPALAALQEPWWMIAVDTLRTSRPAQIAAAAAFAGIVLTAGWLWPRGAGITSLSELRRYPSNFDGRTVTVRGRVGNDVFSVGAGWAFYLVQGRDTIVTFTPLQMPKPRDRITVKGQVSTGFLDGVPRQALFESADTSR
jgi:hypothetical protein